MFSLFSVTKALRFAFGGTLLLSLLNQPTAASEYDSEERLEAREELADMRIRPSQYQYAAVRAAMDGNVEMLKLLVAAGANINAGDQNGETPLSWAAAKGMSECVRYLLSLPGIKVNRTNINRQTPLYRAVLSNEVECVELLLEARGIDVNMASVLGWSPLHLAARYGCDDIVELLLNHDDINVNARDREGKTPLDDAERYNNEECANLIRRAGGENGRSNTPTPAFHLYGSGHGGYGGFYGY